MLTVLQYKQTAATDYRNLSSKLLLSFASCSQLLPIKLVFCPLSPSLSLCLSLCVWVNYNVWQQAAKYLFKLCESTIHLLLAYAIWQHQPYISSFNIYYIYCTLTVPSSICLLLSMFLCIFVYMYRKMLWEVKLNLNYFIIQKVPPCT